jgi:hypothetical protein
MFRTSRKQQILVLVLVLLIFVDIEKSGKLKFSKMKSGIHFPNLVS